MAAEPDSFLTADIQAEISALLQEAVAHGVLPSTTLESLNQALSGSSGSQKSSPAKSSPARNSPSPPPAKAKASPPPPPPPFLRDSRDSEELELAIFKERDRLLKAKQHAKDGATAASAAAGATAGASAGKRRGSLVNLDDPLLSRFDEWLNKKNEKAEQAREEARKQREKETVQAPDLSASKRTFKLVSGATSEISGTLLERMEKWQRERDLRHEMALQSKEKAEIEACTFEPEITTMAKKSSGRLPEDVKRALATATATAAATATHGEKDSGTGRSPAAEASSSSPSVSQQQVVALVSQRQDLDRERFLKRMQQARNSKTQAEEKAAKMANSGGYSGRVTVASAPKLRTAERKASSPSSSAQQSAKQPSSHSSPAHALSASGGAGGSYAAATGTPTSIALFSSPVSTGGRYGYGNKTTGLSFSSPPPPVVPPPTAMPPPPQARRPTSPYSGATTMAMAMAAATPPQRSSSSSSSASSLEQPSVVAVAAAAASSPPVTATTTSTTDASSAALLAAAQSLHPDPRVAAAILQQLAAQSKATGFNSLPVVVAPSNSNINGNSLSPLSPSSPPERPPQTGGSSRYMVSASAPNAANIRFGSSAAPSAFSSPLAPLAPASSGAAAAPLTAGQQWQADAVRQMELRLREELERQKALLALASMGAGGARGGPLTGPAIRELYASPLPLPLAHSGAVRFASPNSSSSAAVAMASNSHSHSSNKDGPSPPRVIMLS